ncbi:MAG: XRE family transcriptional regulator [Candidatus Omnitrophota bacterium]|nr:XRE family transcriptional regulator [Candidatus Omnitrophota bacterium]
MPKVNPNILRWAREKARLTLEEAAEKLGLPDIKNMSASDRLVALEKGKDEPTRSLLVKMTKQYRRPLLTFYMSTPPRQGERGQDFRTLTDNYAIEKDVILDTLIRDIYARQSMLCVVLKDEEDAKPLPFIDSTKLSDGISVVLKSIQQTIPFDLDVFYNKPSPENAFAYLRSTVEKTGVFVLLISNLGSHHTSIEVEMFRGFALADNIAPFVIINDQDSKTAWSFTLLHELAHLWLGQTGISGLSSNKTIEKFCNDVASEFLLPTEKLRLININSAMESEEIKTSISEFARSHNLSGSMVAYKLFRTGLISESLWHQLSHSYRELWYHAMLKQRTKARESEGGGPSYYMVRRHRIGVHLITLVQRMMAAGSLTTSKAAKVLGIKPQNIQTLINSH